MKKVFILIKNEIYDDEYIDEKIEKGEYLIDLKEDRHSALSNNSLN